MNAITNRFAGTYYNIRSWSLRKKLITLAIVLVCSQPAASFIVGYVLPQSGYTTTATVLSAVTNPSVPTLHSECLAYNTKDLCTDEYFWTTYAPQCTVVLNNGFVKIISYRSCLTAGIFAGLPYRVLIAGHTINVWWLWHGHYQTVTILYAV